MTDTTFYEGPGSSADWELKMPGEPGYRTADQVIADAHGAAHVAERVEGAAADVRSYAPSPAGEQYGQQYGEGAPSPADYSAGLEVGGRGDAQDDDEAPAGSLLDRFRAELGRKVTPTYPVAIPNHPSIELIVRTDWSEETYRKWKAMAKDRKAEDGVNNSKLIRALLAQQTVRILFDGVVMTEDGIPWTFKHPACQREFGANTPEQAVNFLLPSFPQLIAVGNEVSEAAGKGPIAGGGADPT